MNLSFKCVDWLWTTWTIPFYNNLITSPVHTQRSKMIRPVDSKVPFNIPFSRVENESAPVKFGVERNVFGFAINVAT